MAKFKIGDKVIRTGTTTETVIRGQIYTVSSTTFSNINGNIFNIVGDSKYSYTEDGFDLAPSLPTDRPLTYDETQMLKNGDVVKTHDEYNSIQTVLTLDKHAIYFKDRCPWNLIAESKTYGGRLYFVSHGKEESKEEKKEEVKSKIEDFYTPKHFDCRTQSVIRYPESVTQESIESALKEIRKEKPVLKSVSQILYGRR